MIPPDVLRELRYIEVYSTRKIRNLRVGPFTSPLRGPGFDFDEHRPYRPGDDVRRIYRMADLYVMPSVSEPFGIAPLEAISNDVPVIISKQSGVSEVLTHALKVDFWDTAEMANKILAVLRHPPLGQTLREHGAIEVRRLTWEGAAMEMTRLYERAGFTAEGVRRAAVFRDGAYADTRVMSLVR